MGGVYATHHLYASRPGSQVVGAYVAMLLQGTNQYIENCKLICNTCLKLTTEIEKIKGLKVIGQPLLCAIGFLSTDKKLNIFAIHQLLSEKGWNIPTGQKPNCLRISLTLPILDQLNN